ncbi:hypothetical protein Hanom_Chr15g01373411 [Helianthus anomalus]
MGEFKLRANISRFAVENSRPPVQPELKSQAPRPGGVSGGIKSFNIRDSRSYCDVVGKSNGGGVAVCEPESSLSGAMRELFKSLVVPDRTEAFKELKAFEDC